MPNPLTLLARPAGFEPATYGFVDLVNFHDIDRLKAHRGKVFKVIQFNQSDSSKAGGGDS